MNVLKMLQKRQGFSLVELAIVLVIVGLLAGGGMSLMRSLSQRKARTETMDHLAAAREALVNFAVIQGRLPPADTTGDGQGDSGSFAGNLPATDLAVRPMDPFRRRLTYAVNAQLTVNRDTTCRALKTGLAGAPLVVDSDGAATAAPMALVMVSSGPMDADGDGNPFDMITSGSHQGDNTDGAPNYLRYPPVTTFDDMTAYAGGSELYRIVCGDPALSVSNTGGAPVYLYDVDAGQDVATIAAGDIWSQRIYPGTIVELRSAPAGGGAIVSSTPATPLILSGNGRSVAIP